MLAFGIPVLASDITVSAFEITVSISDIAVWVIEYILSTFDIRLSDLIFYPAFGQRVLKQDTTEHKI